MHTCCFNNHMVDIVKATVINNLPHSTILGRHGSSSMDPPDPGAKLTEGSQAKPCVYKGRKAQSPPLPSEPNSPNPVLGIITKREFSIPRKKTKQKEKSGSVKDPTQSSAPQKETVPPAPQVIRRSKSIRRIKGDPSGEYPVGTGFQSPPALSTATQPTSALRTPDSILNYDTGPTPSPISSLPPSPEQGRTENRQIMRNQDSFLGYDSDNRGNTVPMDGFHSQSLSNLADTHFRQEQVTQRNMTQNTASRHETQGDLTKNQSQSQPRTDPIQYGYGSNRISLPMDTSTSQEIRSTQAHQESVQIEDLGSDRDADQESLYAPQNANWRSYNQFQDPVQGIQRKPRTSPQEAPRTGIRRDNYNFLRPEIPKAEIEVLRPPRTDIPRQEFPRLLRSETHPPGLRSETHPPGLREIRAQREADQQPPQATSSQEQALRLQLDLTTQLASLQAKVLEANNNKVAKTVPPQTESPVEGEISDEEYSEEEETDWAGRVIDKEDSKEGFLSADASAYWNSLIGIDEAGIKTLKFKKPLKQTIALAKFSEGEFVISAPVHNNELPRLASYDQKKEDDMFSDQRHIAAASTSVCMSVDGARKTIGDLRDSAIDFAEGRVDEPAKEAYRIMLATAALLEEEVITNSIQATKFLASTFGAISLSK